jgi:hypothetical protein
MGFDNLVASLKKIGYNPKIGPLGSLTIAEEGRTNPETGGSAVPGLPGVVHVPADRALTPEEVRHEGTHALLGAPGAFLGQLGTNLLGLNKGAGYLAPDEVLAYLSQPSSPATSADMSTLADMASASNKGFGKTPLLTQGYLSLVKALANARK